MRRVFCVLGGGRSRRFAGEDGGNGEKSEGKSGEKSGGGNKLTVVVDGIPILRWVHARLCGDTLSGKRLGGNSFDTSWLVLAPEQVLPAGAEVFESIVRDDKSFGGPMRAIAGLLDKAETDDELVIVAGDMPGVTLDYVERLRAFEGDAAIVMGQHADGLVEPMPGLWRVAQARAVMDAALRDGVRVGGCVGQGVEGPSGLVGRNGVGVIAIDRDRDRQVHVNINTRADMASVGAALGVVVDG